MGCQETSDNEPQESKIVAMSRHDAETGTDYQGTVSDDCVLFTGDDIAWFNPETREIKFSKITPGIYSLPVYSQIDIKLNDELLFTIVAHINGAVNRAYDDLVLFYDLDSGKYFLQDNYPSYWDPENTQINAEKRASGWAKFIHRLKEEKKLRN